MKCKLLAIIILVLVLWPLAAAAQYDFTWAGWGGPPESNPDWVGSWSSAGDTYSNGWGNTWYYTEDPTPYYPGSTSAVLLPAGFDIRSGHGICATLDIEVGASLRLPYSTLNIHGPTLHNDGAIYMSNYTATLGLVRLLGDLELTGAGDIFMDGGLFADIGVARSLTVGAQQTITGWGGFGHDSYWGVVNLHNLGSITASSTHDSQFLALHSVESVNDSLLASDSAELHLYGIWNNHGGVIRAGDGSIVYFKEVAARLTEIIGGVLETQGSGEIRPESGSLIENVTAEGRLHLLRYRAMNVRTGVTINEIFDIGSDGSAGFAMVNLVSDVRLDGTGVVGVHEANQIRCIEWPSENFDLTIGSDLTMELVGGRLGWEPDYYGDRRIELYNEGTIICRGEVYPPLFYVTGAGFTNSGSLQVDSETLPAKIHGAYLQTDGETRVEGQLRFEETPASFIGGSLGGTGWLVGSVAISGDARLEPGVIDSAGTFSLSGHLTLEQGAEYCWDYSAGAQDLMYLSGNLALEDTLTLTVEDLDGNGLAAGDYVLLEAGGEITDSATWDITLPSDWLCSGVEVVGQQVILRELRLNAIAVDEGEVHIPLALLGAVPNPFNPSTEISFSLESTGSVTLNIFDTRGRLVRTLMTGENLGSGHHAVRWNGLSSDGTPVVSGTYLYRLTTGGRSLSAKMTMIK